MSVPKQPWELRPRTRCCAECDVEFVIRSEPSPGWTRFCSERCRQRQNQRKAKRRIRERQHRVLQPSSLEMQLRALPPLAPATGKVDIRTKEGKKQKPRLLKELIALRERGYLLAEISAVLGISESTLSMWLLVAGRRDLAYLQKRVGKPANGYCHVCGTKVAPNSNGRPRKYCGTQCTNAAGKSTNLASLRQAEEAGQIHQATLARDRRDRISTLRAEYRRCRKEGEPLPWHLLRREPKLTVEQKMELELLAREQERDRATVFAAKRPRPWLVSLDEPIPLKDESEGDDRVLADVISSPAWLSENAEIEALMLNGYEGSPRPVRQRAWRVYRPSREGWERQAA